LAYILNIYRGIAVLATALDMKPLSPELLVILALAHISIGDEENADYFFRKAAYLHRTLTGQSTADLETMFNNLYKSIGISASVSALNKMEPDFQEEEEDEEMLEEEDEETEEGHRSKNKGRKQTVKKSTSKIKKLSNASTASSVKSIGKNRSKTKSLQGIKKSKKKKLSNASIASSVSPLRKTQSKSKSKKGDKTKNKKLSVESTASSVAPLRKNKSKNKALNAKAKKKQSKKLHGEEEVSSTEAEEEDENNNYGQEEEGEEEGEMGGEFYTRKTSLSRGGDKKPNQIVRYPKFDFIPELTDLIVDDAILPPLRPSIMIPWNVTETSDKLKALFLSMHSGQVDDDEARRQNMNMGGGEDDLSGVASNNVITAEYDQIAKDLDVNAEGEEEEDEEEEEQEEDNAVKGKQKKSKSKAKMSKRMSKKKSTKKSQQQIQELFQSTEEMPTDSQLPRKSNVKGKKGSNKKKDDKNVPVFVNRLGSELIWAGQLLLQLRVFDVSDNTYISLFRIVIIKLKLCLIMIDVGWGFD
jgi:hypothetical protein